VEAAGSRDLNRSQLQAAPTKMHLSLPENRENILYSGRNYTRRTGTVKPSF